MFGFKWNFLSKSRRARCQPHRVPLGPPYVSISTTTTKFMTDPCRSLSCSAQVHNYSCSLLGCDCIISESLRAHNIEGTAGTSVI